MNKPCPSCPDGYVWTTNGPTSKMCPRCNGNAFTVEGDDSLQATKPKKAKYPPGIYEAGVGIWRGGGRSRD